MRKKKLFAELLLANQPCTYMITYKYSALCDCGCQMVSCCSCVVFSYYGCAGLFVGLRFGFLLPPVNWTAKKYKLGHCLVYTFKLFDKAGKIPANMLLSNQWWISKNLPFRFFFPSFPLGFPSQPGRVLTSGSAGEHSLTHLFDFRLSVKPCLHSEQIPDVQLRQPRAQLSENKNSVNNYCKKSM